MYATAPPRPGLPRPPYNPNGKSLGSRFSLHQSRHRPVVHAQAGPNELEESHPSAQVDLPPPAGIASREAPSIAPRESVCQSARKFHTCHPGCVSLRLRPRKARPDRRRAGSGPERDQTRRWRNRPDSSYAFPSAPPPRSTVPGAPEAIALEGMKVSHSAIPTVWGSRHRLPSPGALSAAACVFGSRRRKEVCCPLPACSLGPSSGIGLSSFWLSWRRTVQ
jgi:hypothetical protein